MFGIGGTEFAIILIFGFLIFGPDKLPAMGRTLGRALRQFRQAQDQMNKMVQSEIVNPLNDVMKEPAKKQGPKKKITGAGTAAKPETFAEKKARLAAEAAESAKNKDAEQTQASTEEQAAPVVKKEGVSQSFAERKARLEAEKAAAEVKKTTSASTGGVTKPKTSSATKKSSSSAAKLYGIDKDRIAAARAKAAAKQAEKEEQADA